MNDLMTKSFLSYVELKKQAQKDLESEVNIGLGQLDSSHEPNLSSFFKEVDLINSQVEEIANLLVDLQNLNEETKSTHSYKVLRGLRDRVESDIVSVLRKAKDVTSMLDSLDKSNEANRRLSGLYKAGSPVDRTRMSVTNGMRVKLKEIMSKFQLLRDKIVSEYKGDFKRRYFNATGEEPSEELIEKMISYGDGYQIFRVKTEMDSKTKERHDAVMDIQRSLKRLHQVFLDMAVVVETQGHAVDIIEDNVANASDFISGGTNSLYYAHQMKRRKTSVYWVLAVVLLILLVCVIATLVS